MFEYMVLTGLKGFVLSIRSLCVFFMGDLKRVWNEQQETKLILGLSWAYLGLILDFLGRKPQSISSSAILGCHSAGHSVT